MKVEDIAKICHQANKAYCESLGDDSQKDWEDAPEWQRDSVVNGVEYFLTDTNLTAEDMHKSWMKKKVENGWKYGVEKDEEKKTHPNMESYSTLPLEQKTKDIMFIAIIDVLYFALMTPNAKTIQAIKNVMEGKNLIHCKDIEDLIDKLEN